jgi:hypothetical protein
VLSGLTAECDRLQEDVEAAPGEDELLAKLCASVRGLLHCDNDADHVRNTDLRPPAVDSRRATVAWLISNQQSAAP